MISKLKSIFTAAVVALSVATPFALAPMASAADIAGGLCAGANLSASSAQDCKTDASTTNKKIDDIIKTAIDLFSLVVGIVAVIMIIVGGLKYITSGGDSGNVTGAKNTILYAVIGLVVVALAQFIVKFVLGKVTGNA